MSNRLPLFLGGFLAAVMIAACAVAVLKIDLTPKAEKGKPVERTRNFGEGLKLAQHGLYGVDLVSIGRAHMRKLRKGPFTIGAINELVLEDVALVLPEELWNVDAAARRVDEEGEDSALARRDAAPTASGPRAMLAKLGLNAGNLRMGDKVPRFSALAIRNLRVSRLVESNAVPWFVASRGEAERGGLKLYTGYTVEGGATNVWSEGFLSVDPALRLYTR